MVAVYRVMRKDENSKPVCGQGTCELGVRVPPGEYVDVYPEGPDQIVPVNSRGMCCSPRTEDLPLSLLPKREWNGQSRDRNRVVFRIENPMIPKTLDLFQTKPGHLVVRPREPMPIVQYQDGLQSTKNDWSMVSPPQGGVV